MQRGGALIGPTNSVKAREVRPNWCVQLHAHPLQLCIFPPFVAYASVSLYARCRFGCSVMCPEADLPVLVHFLREVLAGAGKAEVGLNSLLPGRLEVRHARAWERPMRTSVNMLSVSAPPGPLRTGPLSVEYNTVCEHSLDKSTFSRATGYPQQTPDYTFRPLAAVPLFLYRCTTAYEHCTAQTTRPTASTAATLRPGRSGRSTCSTWATP